MFDKFIKSVDGCLLKNEHESVVELEVEQMTHEMKLMSRMRKMKY